jgi:hypothetical protein
MYKKLIIILALVFLVAGCMPRIYTETGKKFDVKNFKQVIVKRTTKNDLLSSLGPPQQTGIKESGKEMWTYLFLSLEHPSSCFLTKKTSQTKHKFMRMTITFDKDVVFEKSYEMTKEKE